jgi:integrase
MIRSHPIFPSRLPHQCHPARVTLAGWLIRGTTDQARRPKPVRNRLPIKPGLTVHGLRHAHKTWMAEHGIRENFAEQRLGHELPGTRGLYARTSGRMRDDLKQALQTCRCRSSARSLAQARGMSSISARPLSSGS